MSHSNWKEKLKGTTPEAFEREIDIYETQLTLMRQGKMDEKLFIETRLRRGAYGQRYDNGQRHDGEKTQTLHFPCGDLKKGPSTVWDAPGMHRIKIPFGKMTPEQMDCLAETAEEYSDGILHVTTRQDIQLHFVHIDDTTDLMRRLASVGITTREACGNSVRNVTACPYSGVCDEESFDVTPYANAVTYFLLGHPDVQDFGRKFKIAFSGCKHNPCGLVNFHDLGAIAVTRKENGQVRRGFEFYVGGGLGSVPQDARLIEAFLPEEELLPMCQAVCRVFARLGEKKNRARARIKFLVQKLGTEEFQRLVREERAQLREDVRWKAFLSEIHALDERPIRALTPLNNGPYPAGFEAWRATNIRPQRQAGYVVATVLLPLGDLTSDQMRSLSDLARKFSPHVRTTVEQNLVFRWLNEGDLPDFYLALQHIGLAESGANTISDLTSCPGTDTCKLGISSSRGLTGELRRRLAVVHEEIDPAVKNLRIKASGCFNSCGQHHVADMGFLGVSRNVQGRRVPHFQLVVGGQWTHNAASYGLGIGAIPSKNVPAVVERIADHYVKDRAPDETFKDFVQRVGKSAIRTLIDDLTKVPSYETDPDFYRDWGDPREYTIGDMGDGECAGEVVPFIQFGLQASEREAFEAQIFLEHGNPTRASELAYNAMLTAAKALVRHRGIEVTDEPNDVVAQFRTHLDETQLFHDPYAGGKFSHYFFKAHRQEKENASTENARQAIEEATLFIEAAHACYERMLGQTKTAQPVSG